LAFPFYFLDPHFEGKGRQWWEKKLNALLNLNGLGRDQTARSLLCIEYFPYHSRRFAHAKLKLQSQKFGFDLVRSAINRDAIVVIMRSKRRWLAEIPELGKHPRAFPLNSPQNVVISPGNCPEGKFDLIVSAIREYRKR
jgi:hypothetical protein